MTAAAAMLAASFSGHRYTVLLWIVLGVAALVVLFLALFMITCLCETQHLAGDVEPAREPYPYPPSPYWLQTRHDAARIGLRRAGDFATRADTSKVKGLESLFFTEDACVLVSVVSGSFGVAKLKKTVLHTRLASGRIILTTDNAITRDVTGVIQSGVLLNTGIEALMRYHMQRVWAADSVPVPFNTGTALEESSRIYLERGRRLVATRRAYWVNPQQTRIRLTLRGAIAYAKDMVAQTSELA